MKILLLLIALAAFVSYASLLIWRAPPSFSRWIVRESRRELRTVETETALDKAAVFEARNITPLPKFDWRTTEPLKFRPFKPKFHLTMGLSNIPISNLLEMDRNYLKRLEIRKEVIATYPDVAIQASSSVTPAVDELYTWLVNIYLPTRFPTMFTLFPSSGTLLNIATSLFLPLTPPSDTAKALQLLGENLDVELLLLLPDEKGDGYRLQGYVACFTNGFNTKEKFGLKLREIHRPVPGYKEKLELSMDRFFDKVEVGRCVMRTNWSITPHDELFAPGGLHLYEGQTPDTTEEVDINNTFLRCERQTLHRLPRTKALLFAFKTYLHPLQEIKDEGSGEILADAIDGLTSGSVPKMYFYKRGVVWGDKVKEFLRGQELEMSRAT